MILFIAVSWFNDKGTPCVYNLSCIGVHGAHTTVQFECSIALDMFIPERVLLRTGKSPFEMKQGMAEADALKLLHDIAEKAEHVICYSKVVCDLLHAISERYKFRRKVSAIGISEYYKHKTGQHKTIDELLAFFGVTTKSTERTAIDDCELLKMIYRRIK